MRKKTQFANQTTKAALVTGGSGEIGSAICRKLVASGFTVYIHTHLQLEKARRLADELNADLHANQNQGVQQENKDRAHVVQFDVTNPQQTKSILEALVAHTPISVVVNNAGIHDDAVFPAMTDTQWHRVIDTSLHGFFHVTQPLIMPMARQRYGRIINISSIAALCGNRGQTNYAAAKAALHGASKSLALELASRAITVNVVAPGVIATAMVDNTFSAEFIQKQIPMQRMGTSEEVAHLVNFLASEEASYITGQIIAVSGGIV